MEKQSKPKSIILRAFRIENQQLTKSSSGILALIKQKLDDNSVANERRLTLNPDDINQEEDLLADFQYRGSNNSSICGLVIRLMPKKDAPGIPSEMFDESRIPLSELDSIENGDNQSIICKDYYYFYMNDNYLVTNLRQNINISRFQTYINWLLIEERGDIFFDINPMVTIPPSVNLKNIKSIKFQDPIYEGEKEKETIQKKSLGTVALDKMKDLFTSTADFKQLVDLNIVSAEILVKFTKPKEVSKETYERAMAAYLKPISDTDNVTLTTKNNGTIKSSEVLKTKKVEIEVTETNKIVEEQLYQEMEKFIKEIKSDEKDN